jgi:hypothetical protein
VARRVDVMSVSGQESREQCLGKTLPAALHDMSGSAASIIILTK